MGDFNQRIRQGAFVPSHLGVALRNALPESMTIATSALLGARGIRSIDHITLSEDMAAESLSVISNMYGKTELSDHFGVVANLSAQNLR